MKKYMHDSLEQEEPFRVAQVLGYMGYGGVEAVVLNYYRSIDRSRVQFDFFLDERSLFPQEAEVLRLGGRVFRLPPYSKPMNYLIALSSLLKQGNYRILHANLSTMNFLPLFAGFIAGVQVRICHNHSTAHVGETKTLLKILLRPLAPLFATHKAACGEYAAQWMYGSRAVTEDKVVIFPNAIDTARFAFQPEIRAQKRKELGIGEETVIGNVGRFVYQKNHSWLLDVFKEYLKKEPNAKLLLVGEGELQQALEEKALQLGIAEHVIFAGAVKDTAPYYQAMDGFCLTSFYEGMPVVAVEAQTSGLSCLFSDNITVEADITGKSRYLSLKETAQKWAQALATLKTVDEEQRMLARRKVAEKNFDIQKAAFFEMNYYRQALKMGKG